MNLNIPLVISKWTNLDKIAFVAGGNGTDDSILYFVNTSANTVKIINEFKFGLEFPRDVIITKKRIFILTLNRIFVFLWKNLKLSCIQYFELKSTYGVRNQKFAYYSGFGPYSDFIIFYDDSNSLFLIDIDDLQHKPIKLLDFGSSPKDLSISSTGIVGVICANDLVEFDLNIIKNYQRDGGMLKRFKLIEGNVKITNVAFTHLNLPTTIGIKYGKDYKYLLYGKDNSNFIAKLDFSNTLTLLKKSKVGISEFKCFTFEEVDFLSFRSERSVYILNDRLEIDAISIHAHSKDIHGYDLNKSSNRWLSRYHFISVSTDGGFKQSTIYKMSTYWALIFCCFPILIYVLYKLLF